MFKKTTSFWIALLSALLAVSLVFGATPEMRKYGTRWEQEAAHHATPPANTVETYQYNDLLYWIDENGYKGVFSGPKSKQIPLNSFYLDSGAPVSTTTQPRLAKENNVQSLIWEEGQTTPAVATIVMPQDYVEGAALKIIANDGNSTTPNRVDFDVWVFADWDAFSTTGAVVLNETAVALSGTVGNENTPDEVTLTPSTSTTDFAALLPGEATRWRLWRDDRQGAAGSTGALEIKSVILYYR